MTNPVGECLKVEFDGSLGLDFHGSRVTSDAGMLAHRELDEALGLFDSAERMLDDFRTGRKVQHDLTALVRQSVYSCLAGYEDVNDAERLSVNPAMRAITGKLVKDESSASANILMKNGE